jgi:putative ABC transport system permease protein
MFRTALRSVLAHKARLLMTVLAVLLGVAFVSGTLIFTDTLGNAYTHQSAKDHRHIAVSVSSDENHSLASRDLDRFRTATGVASVAGRVTGFAGVADRHGRLIGSDWSNNGGNFAPGKGGDDPAYDFTAGTGPRAAGQIALDKGSAAKGGYHVGDRVRVATAGPVRTYTLSGVFTTDDGAVDAGGSLVLFDTAEAQRLYLRPGFFQDAEIAAAPGTSQDTILAEVTPLLPHGTGVRAKTGRQLADDEAKAGAESLSTLNEMLLAFAGIALFVGVFLISNTFTMLVAQRTRELALLRAVGASRRQVRRTVLVEAGIVGVVASVVGFALGIGLAVGLRSAMTSFGARIPAGPLVISPDAVGAAFAVGVLITLLAAWLPSRRAAKIPPVAALGSAHVPPTTRSLVVRNTIGAAVAAFGAVGIAGGASVGSDSGRLLIAGGAFLMLIGVIVLIPLLSRPAVALVRPLLRGAFGTPGTLASRNAVRNPRRTGATASALAIGLTLVTGLTVIGVTLGSALDRMTTDSLKADYMVSMASGGTLDPSVASSLAKTPGVAAVSPQEAATLRIGGTDHAASAVTPGDIEQVLRIRIVDGSLSTLSSGGIAVAEKTAVSSGWRVGDTVSVRYDDGGKGRLKVGATYKDSAFLSPLLVSTAVVDPHERKQVIPEVWVKAAGGASAAREQAMVKALGDSPAFAFSDRADIRSENGGVIDTALDILYALLAMALIISVLGVVNTLAMSVFERQQEIGMLRAIGLDRRQVKRMIRVEAVVISMFGAVVGVALGTFLAWAIGQTFKDSVPGYTLVLPWLRIVIFLGLAGVVGVLAALWPARSAALLNMLTAIKTD